MNQFSHSNINTTRMALVFFFLCLLYGIIIINSYNIQIIWHDFYVNLAKKQYKVTLTQLPPRAPIYDTSGTKLLAMNIDSVTAFIVPKKLTEPEKIKPFLKKYFPQAYKKLLKNPGNNFLYVQRKLSPEQLAIINKHELADIQLLTEPHRFYPALAASPLVGITSIDNKGLFGIEAQYESLLAGTPSTHTLEKDARSGRYYFTKETTVTGSPGTPITLTIDSDLQFLVYQELDKTLRDLEAQEGAVIIMNPQNGEIITMASSPIFDPNNTHELAIEHTKNRLITQSYEAGSVMKVFCALAALEENCVTLDEIIDCGNSKTVKVDGRTINTVKAHGAIPFCDVIAQSNNIGIAKVAQRLGPKLYDHYKQLGFGQRTGINLTGEQPGFINPPNKWSKQSIISLSYGYEITCTLLQIARAFALIANNGYPVTPVLVKSPVTINSKNNTPVTALYKPDSIKDIKTILEQTTLHGTAHRAKMQGYKVMTKTGTANILENGVYNSKRNIYSCAGIIEKDGYQRVIVTFVKETNLKNAYAATVAVPLYEKVAQKMVIHDKIL